MTVEATNNPGIPPGRVPGIANKLLKVVLRSPLHRMISSQLMLITFRGRKSGKQFTTPVGYMQDGQQITLFTDHQWWRNLRDNAQVSVVVKGKTYQGSSNVILDKTITEQELQRYLGRLPNAARAFQVQKNAAGELDPIAIHEAAQRFTMMRIDLH
ncbi:nitroreductase/quinone reductase family protein [Dictyobacter kobayashii]|uniref:Nitroreductase n=1 Tax=Dictyobacter kobayashii TaxID=2014872 RepID=A0A402ATN9_9CHLR|nr:nitroreductase/quinone reductase family protein [Dictyobacter kobayashii]GCE22480.1 hypothetical protein KDK_62800 [Dictyobacter kobayashii]